jgi:hypothetical protein
MVSTRRQKHAVAAASNPLKDAGILRHVFSFLPGSYLFIGAVCNEWSQSYACMENQQLCKVSLYNNINFVMSDCRSTLYCAAVASPATARLAARCGLMTHKNTKLQIISGLHAGRETLAALLELGMPLSDTVLEAVALSGRLNILQHLFTQQQCPRPTSLSCYAARSGSISMLSWLNDECGYQFNWQTCAGAAQGGQLAVLQHLRRKGCVWETDYIACWAATSGSVEAVEWLRQQPGIVIDANVLAWAAGTGQIALCKHLHSAGCNLSADACTHAAGGHHPGMLRWLREHGCPWDASEVITAAGFNGCTEILDYVVQQGEALSTELLTVALNCAGSYNHLEAAQWLRQRGAGWPAVLGAGENPDIRPWRDAMVVWARAEGCTAPAATAEVATDSDSNSGSDSELDDEE